MEPAAAADLDTSNDEAIARAIQAQDDIDVELQQASLAVPAAGARRGASEPVRAAGDPAMLDAVIAQSESQSARASPVLGVSAAARGPGSKTAKSRFFGKNKSHKRSKSSGAVVGPPPAPLGQVKPAESLSELASGTYNRLKGSFDGWREKQRELAQQRDGAHRGLGRLLTSIGLPRLPASELVNIYKKFILNFEQLCVDPTVTTEMMSESVLVLYIQVEDAMVSSQVWSTISDALLDNAQDTFEKFVMDQLYDLVFLANEDDETEDLNLAEKIRGLRWVTHEHLDASCNLASPVVVKNFELAQDSLILMDAERAPVDKLERVVTASKAIFEVLNGSAEGSPAGADDFLPVLIYTIIKANPPMLYSNLQYVTRFCNPTKLSTGEAGYFYTNLYSAVAFIGKIDAESLKISPKEFERQMKVNDMSRDVPPMENQNMLLESLERLAELDIAHKKIRADLDSLEQALVQSTRLASKVVGDAPAAHPGKQSAAVPG